MVVLTEISDGDVQKLLLVLKQKLPDSVVAVNWISTQIAWKEKCPEMKVQIFCPDGDWSEGIVVCLAEGAAASNKIFGVVHAPEERLDVLKEALMTTDVIDWDRMTQFSSCLKRFLPIFAEILKQRGFKYGSDAIVPSVIFYMPIESAVASPLPVLPTNVRVGALDISLLDTICENWASYEPEYRPVVVRNIELNSTVGVFLKNEDGQEALCSMVMHAEYGGVGVMQTLPEFRRRGFGSTALAFLTRAFGNKGLCPYGNIFVENDKSISLFQKCGYKLLGDTATVYIRK